MINKNELRERLFTYLRKHPVTMTRLADDIGVSFVTFSSFMNDKGKPYITTLLKIEKYLNEKDKDE